MKVAATALLQADLRFRAAPLDLRGLYRMLLDFQDAAGDVTARGSDAVAAAAAALGCTRDEAAPLLARMEAHDLVRVEASRVCLLVGSARGARGGMSDAERKRLQRARQPVTVGHGQVTGDVTGRVTGQFTAQHTETPVESSNCHDRVTGDVTDRSRPDVTVTARDHGAAGRRDPAGTSGDSTRDAARDTTPGAPAPEGPGGSPASPLPSLPHSPSLTLPPATPSDRGRAGGRTTPDPAAQDATAPRRPRAQARVDASEPMPGTPAAATLAALRATRLLLPIVARPCELAVAVAGGAFPALDLPREVAAAEAWLVANPANAKQNGARFLTGWLQRAQERAPRAARAASAAGRDGRPDPNAPHPDDDAVEGARRRYRAALAAQAALAPGDAR